MPYDVRPITETRFRDTERIAQVTRHKLTLFRHRPQPPRGVHFTPPSAPTPPSARTFGMVAWEPPHETRNVTHYNIYAPDENTMVDRVPIGTYIYGPFPPYIKRVLVSSYNDASEMESRKVPEAGPIPWV
jgi:hypothetical protein